MPNTIIFIFTATISQILDFTYYQTQNNLHLHKKSCIEGSMGEILISWIGATDLRASINDSEIGLGPLAQAASAAPYREIALVSDYGNDKTASYIKWLR